MIYHTFFCNKYIIYRLGMTHDGLDNDCKMESAGYPHMMAGQWPTSNHLPMKWSKCSRKKLTGFLKYVNN